MNLQPSGLESDALPIEPYPHMHLPGIEPGLLRWQRSIIPLDHKCNSGLVRIASNEPALSTLLYYDLPLRLSSEPTHGIELRAEGSKPSMFPLHHIRYQICYLVGSYREPNPGLLLRKEVYFHCTIGTSSPMELTGISRMLSESVTILTTAP